jgi:hypothetical protein
MPEDTFSLGFDGEQFNRGIDQSKGKLDELKNVAGAASPALGQVGDMLGAVGVAGIPLALTAVAAGALAQHIQSIAEATKEAKAAMDEFARFDSIAAGAEGAKAALDSILQREQEIAAKLKTSKVWDALLGRGEVLPLGFAGGRTEALESDLAVNNAQQSGMEKMYLRERERLQEVKRLRAEGREEEAGILEAQNQFEQRKAQINSDDYAVTQETKDAEIALAREDMELKIFEIQKKAAEVQRLKTLEEEKQLKLKASALQAEKDTLEAARLRAAGDDRGAERVELLSRQRQEILAADMAGDYARRDEILKRQEIERQEFDKKTETDARKEADTEAARIRDAAVALEQQKLIAAGDATGAQRLGQAHQIQKRIEEAKALGNDELTALVAEAGQMELRALFAPEKSSSGAPEVSEAVRLGKGGFVDMGAAADKAEEKRHRDNQGKKTDEMLQILKDIYNKKPSMGL